MRARTRTQRLFQNTPVRSQRSRIEPLLSSTPNAMNWNNLSGVIDEEAVTNWVRAVGFFSSTTFLISVPGDAVFSTEGTLTVISSVNQDFANVKASATVQVAGVGTSVTPFQVDPGDFVAFAAFCSVPAGPITITVTNKPTGATIDTLQLQFET